MNIEKLIDQLSMEEKIKILSGSDFWHTEAVERLKIPSITMTDGPHGVRLAEEGNLEDSKPATSFPIEAASASTWNTELIKEMGKRIADECHYYDVGVILGPGANGKRSPLGGRNFEYYSEDPYLSGKMAVSFIKGVQSKGIGTSIKHFVANEQETNRMVVSSEVDERTLREIYLYPFEMAVKEAHPWTVMCSYNKVNGTYMSENRKYLTNVLKKEWGFDGLIMSDWGAVDNKVESLKGGLDLEMPGPGKEDEKALKAYREDELTIEIINERVRKVLKMIEKIIDNKREVKCDFEANHKLAKKVAQEGIVLLKNSDNILPLNNNLEIAVLGKFAENPRFQGGGSSHMNPHKLEKPLTVLKNFASIDYARAYQEEGNNKKLLKEALETVANKDAVIIFAGTTEKIESEGYDRKNIDIPENQTKVIREAAKINENIIVVTNSGSAINIDEFESKVKGLLHAWLPGQAGAEAIADVIFGKVNPSGKLSETFPLNYKHNPSYLNFPGNIDKVEYKEGVFVGYRYYDTKELDVKYPFGFGLSYTDFEYSDLKIDKDEITNGEKLQISLKVRNTGNMFGKEVVQLYLKDVESSVERPEKELKDFTKVELKPGEIKEIKLELDERDFAFYSEKYNKFLIESGEFEILVGASSRDIRLNSTIKFISQDPRHEILTENHSIEKFLENKDTGEKMEDILKNILHIYKENGIYPIILGMPLKNIVMFLENEEDKIKIYDLLGLN